MQPALFHVGIGRGADFQSAVSQVSNLRTAEKARGLGIPPACRREVGGVGSPSRPAPTRASERRGHLRWDRHSEPVRRARGTQGSVLIIVLWLAFGLVSLTLYFGQSMLFEYRAADQNATGIQADQAIEGAARYISFLLTNMTDNVSSMPRLAQGVSRFEAVPVGDAAFWVIGREDTDTAVDLPFYGLVDEASKLNLNTATLDMLLLLPRMTPQLAAALIDWRDTDSTISTDGAESEAYAQCMPAYLCKNAPFDSIDELRLVKGALPEILEGEDINFNGVLEVNENDDAQLWPTDNRDGRLDPGIMEYLTVTSREPNTGTNRNGMARITVDGTVQTNLNARLLELFGQQRATQIQTGLSAGTGFNSQLALFVASGMTAEEFALICDELTVTNTSFTEGLVNVNTAPAAVLACLPGIGIDKANQLVAYRRSNVNNMTSLAWVMQVLDQASALQAGPYLTAQSYQYAADVVALGPHARGYRRTLFIFDTSDTDPKIIYRRDRSRLQWALGTETLQTWLSNQETR